MKTILLLLAFTFTAQAKQTKQYLTCTENTIGKVRYTCNYNNKKAYDVICYFNTDGKLDFCEAN